MLKFRNTDFVWSVNCNYVKIKAVWGAVVPADNCQAKLHEISCANMKPPQVTVLNFWDSFPLLITIALKN